MLPSAQRLILYTQWQPTTFVEWWKQTTNQVPLEHNTWISAFIASRQSSYLSALEIISGSWTRLKTTRDLWLSKEDKEAVRVAVFGSRGWRTIWCQQTIDNEVGRALMMLQQIKREVNNQIKSNNITRLGGRACSRGIIVRHWRINSRRPGRNNIRPVMFQFRRGWTCTCGMIIRGTCMWRRKSRIGGLLWVGRNRMKELINFVTIN